jgi:diphosphomevalonate decarboxylase
MDMIAVVSRQHKKVGSYDGHSLASTSPMHRSRLTAVPGLMEAALNSIQKRELSVLGPVLEADALAMHAVMITSRPALLYWEPATVAVLHSVRAWRRDGLQVYFTMDAGPNVHCLCEAADAPEVERQLRGVAGVQDILASRPGGGARLVDYDLF